MKNRSIIVAIDGYSSSGKSSMARRLAAEVGYRYIDSGAMYRAVTLYAMRHGMTGAAGVVDTDAIVAAIDEVKIDFRVNPDGSQATMLDGEDVEGEIRGLAVSEYVSAVAAIPQVRHALVAMQQRLGRGKGIVMDGRDIGTTVFPDAEMKVFVDAKAEVRARRRVDELLGKGQSVAYGDVLANIRERDHIDRTRSESPLRRAADAYLLDNSEMTPDQQHALLLELFNKIVAGRG